MARSKGAAAPPASTGGHPNRRTGGRTNGRAPQSRAVSWPASLSTVTHRALSLCPPGVSHHRPSQPSAQVDTATGRRHRLSRPRPGALPPTRPGPTLTWFHNRSVRPPGSGEAFTPVRLPPSDLPQHPTGATVPGRGRPAAHQTERKDDGVAGMQVQPQEKEDIPIVNKIIH